MAKPNFGFSHYALLYEVNLKNSYEFFQVSTCRIL